MWVGIGERARNVKNSVSYVNTCQGAPTTKESVNNRVDKITWPADVGQRHSLYPPSSAHWHNRIMGKQNNNNNKKPVEVGLEAMDGPNYHGLSLTKIDLITVTV